MEHLHSKFLFQGSYRAYTNIWLRHLIGVETDESLLNDLLDHIIYQFKQDPIYKSIRSPDAHLRESLKDRLRDSYGVKIEHGLLVLSSGTEGKPGSQYDPDAGRCPNFWSTFKKFFDEDFFRNDSTVFREEILDEKFAKLFLQSCESTPNLRFPAPTTLDRLARYGDAYVQHFNASRFEGNPWVSARAAQSILNNAIVCITGREPKRSSAEPDDDDDALDTTSIGSTHSCNYCAPVLTKTSYCDDSVPVIPGNACSTRSHAYDIGIPLPSNHSIVERYLLTPCSRTIGY